MTQDDLIQMAGQAGFIIDGTDVCINDRDGIIGDELSRFAALVAAKEREECAKISETASDVLQNSTFEGIAFAIRTRKDDNDSTL